MKPRILVIRGGAIGDFILTLPAIKLLREAFPSAHLEILGYKHIIALAEERFYADATRSIEYGAMSGFFVPGSELAPDLAEYFSGFQQVVSYLFDPDGYFEANLRRAGVKNFLQAYQPIDDAEHAARQLARPLQSMALFLEEHASEIFPSEEDRREAEAFAQTAAGRPLIAIHPGSGSARKNWPMYHWAEVGRRLLADPSRPVLVLIGGEADEQPIDFLLRAWQGAPVLLARDLSLPTLGAVLQRCELFLGHDSGISHLAASVGTRCLLLFGPTDPAVWAPANEKVQTLEAAEGDLSKIPVDDVWREALRLSPLLQGSSSV